MMTSVDTPVITVRAHQGLSGWNLTAVWATPLRRALVVAGVWRIVIGIWGVLAHGMIQHGPTGSQTLMHHGWSRNLFTLLMDAGVREDAWWYARIAQHGYTFSTHHISSIGFNPLFPLTVKAVSVVAGNVYVAGMLISTVCMFVWVWLLAMWLEGQGKTSSSPMAVALMLCFPFAFFWVSMYSESLFLTMALATFVFFERRRWLLAAPFAFLAVLTRPTGLIIAPCLAIAILAQDSRVKNLARRLMRQTAEPETDIEPGPATFKRQEPAGVGGAPSRRYFGPWLPVIAGPLAFGCFAIYQWIAFGTPIAYIRAQAVAPLSRTFSQALSDLMLRRQGFPPWFLAFMLIIAIVFLAAVPLVYRQFGLPYALFAALALLFPLTSGLTAMERYVMIDFPVFAAVATLRWRLIPVAISVLGFYALLAFMALFIAGFTLI